MTLDSTPEVQTMRVGTQTGGHRANGPAPDTGKVGSDASLI